ncbi:MAG: M28 family peptidase [Flavobacteriales bacterium]
MNHSKKLMLAFGLLGVTFVFSPGFQCSRAVGTAAIWEDSAPKKSIDSQERILGVLASDSLEGRGTGTEGERKAAAYIVSQFEIIGLKPMGDDGTWFQTFSYVPHHTAQLHQVGDSVKMGMGLSKEIIGRNVIGYLDNGAATTVVIGAHYDHLGYGDENSLFVGGPAIHNGADDNASGVTAMITLADKISKSNLKNNNYLFMGFSGEEKGLWGSNYFVKNPTIDNMNYMLNMDMVGRLNTGKSLAVSGIGTSTPWEEVLKAENKYGFDLVLTESGVGPSDQTSFYNIGIPAVHFFTGQHEDYHKPSDDADKINYQGLKDVTNYIYDVVVNLNDNGKLDFKKTKDEDTAKAADFKVTLGVMPDYLYSGEGMKIDGVKEERPAALAGMKAGDIVKKIGDMSISDMYSYMEALSKYEKGQTTPVTIERDGKEMVVDVTW